MSKIVKISDGRYTLMSAKTGKGKSYLNDDPFAEFDHLFDEKPSGISIAVIPAASSPLTNEKAEIIANMIKAVSVSTKEALEVVMAISKASNES